MTDPRNTLLGVIDGYSAWGGNPPSSFYHAKSGLVFYGRNERDLITRKIYYSIYTVDITGAIKLKARFGPDTGQGILAVDNGWLILTLYMYSGDGAFTQRIAVPGWTV